MGQINLNNFKVITDKLNTFFVDNKFMVASEIPTTGDFKVGDIIINNGPTNVDEPMWICVEAGNPGTWTVFNSGGGSAADGSAGGGRLSTARNRVVLNGESKSEVSIGVSGFNKASDVLMVFINSRFMTEGVDYEINADSTKIVAIGEVWNEELTSEFEIEMIVFKMMNVNENGEVVVSSANEIVKLKNTVIVNEAVNEVEIGIDGFNEGDDLTVYRNSVYMIEGIDYEVQGNKIVSLKGAWNAEGGSDYKFTFEVIKTVAKVNPNAVVGMEHLNEDVREAIEAAGNIDLSGYQGKSDEGLVTTDKTIVGAINELFQDVDSGKQLIADAIDDSSINKNSTFGAMSEAIEGIHADREEDRQKLVDILVGSNMELTGNESMDTLLDLIDMSNLDLSKIIQVACGYYHTLVLYNDGSVWACGNNDHGRLGLGDTTQRTTFTQVTTNINNDVKQIACGGSHTLVLKNDGSVLACGYNSNGQLGLGTSDTNEHSTFISVADNVKQISCGFKQSFILKNDGSVWSCGHNEYGKLGLGDTTDRKTFTKVTTNINNDVKQIACGYDNIFIIKNDGSLWACGNNNNGQLGLGNTTNRTTFTKVTTNINNDVKYISCNGASSTFMIKNDGSLWACGYNFAWHFGIGDNDSVFNTFTQVTTNINNDVKSVICNYSSSNTFVIKNDGSLWACGRNNSGQLGLNNTTTYKTFTKVTANINNDVSDIDSGFDYAIILKNDGSLWACGNNDKGQLGLGSTASQTTFISVNQTEALQSQVTALQLEATTNRGNLATVLTDEGVELTGDETLADLIVKTDEEFDNIMSSMPKWNGIWADLLKPHPISAIYLMGTSVIGDIIYFTGGGTYNQRYQYNYSYNTTTNTWTKLANIPILISYTTSAAHSTNVYMFSGKNNTTTGSKSTYQYDTVSNTWTAKANVLTNVSESVSETIDDNIYLIGGTNLSTNSIANINQCYNVLTNTWTSKATIPKAMNRQVSVVKGNTIYIVGKGYTYAYSPDTNSWTTLAGCGVSHEYAGAGIIDNEIYVVGGMNSKTSVYIYNIDNNTWETGTNGLPSGNDYTSAEAVNGVLYTFLTKSSKTYCLLNFK